MRFAGRIAAMSTPEERKKRGRPKKPKAKRVALVVRCEQEELDHWHKAAERAKRPLSEVVRDLLDEWSQRARVSEP